MGVEGDIVFLILLGSAVMFLLIMVVITFAVTYNKRMNQKDAEHKLEVKNRELESLREVIEAEEAEREKIALGIHDEVGPLLSTLKLNFAYNIKKLQKNELTEELLRKDQQFLDTVIEDVRAVSHDLSPQYLMKFGLMNAIRKFVDGIHGAKVQVSSSFQGDLPIVRNARGHVYCIVMELVNNIIKHDNSDWMSIVTSEADEHVVIQLIHNGKGITNEDFDEFASNSEGLGLTSIKSRVLIINATLDFQKGTEESSVSLRIPFSK